MRTVHLSYSDIVGGAGRAAYRIHHAVRGHGIDSRMWVNSASSGDWTVRGPGTKWQKALAQIRSNLGRMFTLPLKTSNSIVHSSSALPTHWATRLKNDNPDIVHLHWVADMMSIRDIGKIPKPVVWTLHDMWAFCGAEHVSYDSRWKDGYGENNRPVHESGFDLNRWTWQRKRKHWRRPMFIVTPSHWMADCVRKSSLMRGWPVTVIPNPIDTKVWQPVEKMLAKQILGLPLNRRLIAFGSTQGQNLAHHKGFDLLQGALNRLCCEMSGIELLVFGQSAPQSPQDFGSPAHFVGQFHDDVSLRLLYSAADLLVIPSRVDNFPNTGVEALACGTPVVAFNTCGLPDIVDHLKTGYLAEAFNVEDLARGIQWVLSGSIPYQVLSQTGREKVVKDFDSVAVSRQYENVYLEAIENWRCS